MKKNPTFLIILLLGTLLVSPFSTFAAFSNAGVKPGNFFYFFDTTFEKVSLFFTFSPENKAKKSLEYADERLAEAEAVTDNAEAVKTAITNYESNIAFAEKKSKDIGNKEKAEALLTSIADNTSKHQEILAEILNKVPDEAKDAITRAIEASRKGHAEAMQKIAELKGEVEKLKQEVAQLKSKDEEREKMIEEFGKQKTESSATQQKISTPQTPAIPTLKTEPAKITSVVTLPNGVVVEVDVNGNIIRTIKEVITNIASTPSVKSEILEIISVSISIPREQNLAKIEWQTNKPTESKVFISGGNLYSKKVFTSESGLSTRHIATIVGLARGFKFSYEIEAIAGSTSVAKKTGSFETEAPKLSKIKVYVGSGGMTLDKILAEKPGYIPVQGGGCETLYFGAVVTDQYSEIMFGPEVIMIIPSDSITKTITKDSYIFNNERGIGFWYTPTSINTTETITFKSGGLFVSASIKIGHRLAELPPDRFKQTDDGGWIEVTGGARVDMETKTCIIKQPALR